MVLTQNFCKLFFSEIKGGSATNDLWLGLTNPRYQTCSGVNCENLLMWVDDFSKLQSTHTLAGGSVAMNTAQYCTVQTLTNGISGNLCSDEREIYCEIGCANPESIGVFLFKYVCFLFKFLSQNL